MRVVLGTASLRLLLLVTADMAEEQVREGNRESSAAHLKMTVRKVL